MAEKNKNTNQPTFSVNIADTSRELTKIERVKFKDNGNAIKLDEAVSIDESIIIYPVMWVVLSIHNEKSEDKDYSQYLVVDRDGKKYLTGSPSFWNGFMDIWTEMGGEEGWAIEIYKRESKNYKGKTFLACSVF